MTNPESMLLISTMAFFTMNDEQYLPTSPVEYEETGPRYSAAYLAKIGHFREFANNRYSDNSEETIDDDGSFDRTGTVAPTRDFVEEDDKETENILIPDRLCQPESPTVACCVNNLDFGEGDTAVSECQPASEMYFKSVSNISKIVTLERQTSEETELTFGNLGPINKLNQETKDSTALQNRTRLQVSGWAKLFASTIQRSKSTVAQDGNSPNQKNLKLRPGRKSEQVAPTILSSHIPMTQDSNGLDSMASKAEMRKKKRSIGVDMREKLGFFRRPFGDPASLVSTTTTSSIIPNPKLTIKTSNCLVRLESVWKSTGGPPRREQLMSWSQSFEDLLFDKHGISLFLEFLRSEFSEENLEFWSECQRYRSIGCPIKLQEKATQIYEDYVAEQSPKEINIDSTTRIQTSMDIGHATATTFDQSQKKIQALMEKDSYQRFLRSDIYTTLLSQLNMPPDLVGKLSHVRTAATDQQGPVRVSYIPGLLPNVTSGARSLHMRYSPGSGLLASGPSGSEVASGQGAHRSAPSSPKDKDASTNSS